MNKKNILMLGWEFPPVISGGLGVACQGICMHVAQHHNVLIILPKKGKGKSPANTQILGLNQIDLDNLIDPGYLEVLIPELSIKRVEKVIEINPYHYETILLNEEQAQYLVERIKRKKIEKNDKEPNLFEKQDLYGEGLVQRVILYSKYVQEIAETLDFDLIHAHDWMTFLAGVDLKKRYGKPLVLHVHSLDYDRAGAESRGWVFELERHAMQQADLIIPVSHYTGSIIQSHYKLNPAMIFPVHNGVEPVKVYKKAKKFPEKLVLFLGRITGQKGPEYFLNVAEKVYKEYQNVRFVIAGNGDQLIQMIQEGAYRQLGHRLHFTGFVDRKKVHDLLAMADVYCMPSVSEPFGITALEAAQFGVPVVLSERSGATEVLDSALKADFWDINKMASQIVSLLRNETLHAQKVKEANDELRELTWDKAALKIVSAYEKVLTNV
ncbi:MAG: glycosyltransferase [Cyclobacteriaceae bacterium]|nr:glycosyltransferase [Cyclobacteriaceae bacterium]